MVQGPDLTDVAAVIVSYNSGPYLEACLASLVDEGVGRLIVVDNGSTDRSEAVARQAGAEWIAAGANLGYGRAANLGAAAAGGAADLLVCNPDIEVQPGAVSALVDALADDPSLGAVGPRLLNPDRTLYPSARTFPNFVDAIGHGLLGLLMPGNRFTRRYRLLDWDHQDRARVDWVSGACILVRRQAWDAVGGFDPAYFMYMEDVDLCWRLGRAGWGIAYEPAADVVHVQGVSADLHPYRMLVAHHRSLWRFAHRTAQGRRRLGLPVVLVGLFGRFAVAAVRRRLAGRGRGPTVPAGTSRPRPLA